MEYETWFAQRQTLSAEEGESVYGEIFGETEDFSKHYVGAVQFEAGYLLTTKDGKYHAVAGREDMIGTLEDAARFLWDNHSKYEVNQ